MEPDADKSDPCDDPRVYFAAERTLLAWVRTGLAMMGLGFVVARFGLFLHQLAAVQAVPPAQEHGLSLWLGTTLVLFGVTVNLCAVIKHCRTIRRLEKGLSIPFHPVSLGAIVALLLALIGLLMAGYLLFGLVASNDR